MCPFCSSISALWLHAIVLVFLLPVETQVGSYMYQLLPASVSEGGLYGSRSVLDLSMSLQTCAAVELPTVPSIRFY